MVSYLVMWIHLIAVMIWVGGILFNLLVLSPALGPAGSSSSSGQLLKRIDDRFRTVRWTCILLIILTGFFNVVYEGGTERIESVWGAILMVKVLIAAIAIGLTGLSDFILNPASVPLQSRPPIRSVQWVGYFVVILTLGVLLLSVYLSRSSV